MPPRRLRRSRTVPLTCGHPTQMPVFWNHLYLILLHLGSYFEIILAADLPEMLEATRHIGPVIEQASQ